MKHWTKILFVFISFFLIILPKITFAHPGNTASDGCHYCRTNCDKWGVPWNERHCHGGTVETIQTVQPTSTPRPTIAPTKTPTVVPPTKTPTATPTNTPTPTLTPTPTPTPTEIIPSPTITLNPTKILGATTESKESTTSDNPLGGLAIFAWVVYGTVKLVKKIQNKKSF